MNNKEKKERQKMKKKKVVAIKGPTINSDSSLLKKKTTAIKTVEDKSQMEEKIVEIDRVARVVAGGRRFRFRAAVILGDGNGQLGVGIAKAPEVSRAIDKAKAYARKNLENIAFKKETIPYQIEESFVGARVLLKPASSGTGIIAGGPVRAVLEAAGIQDVLSKILGSANKINNMEATFRALKKLRDLEAKNQLRCGQIKENKKGK